MTYELPHGVEYGYARLILQLYAELPDIPEVLRRDKSNRAPFMDALSPAKRRTQPCTLCAAIESPGFYTGCMVRDGHAPEWNCDGQGNLTLKISPEDSPPALPPNWVPPWASTF